MSQPSWCLPTYPPPTQSYPTVVNNRSTDSEKDRILWTSQSSRTQAFNALIVGYLDDSRAIPSHTQVSSHLYLSTSSQDRKVLNRSAFRSYQRKKFESTFITTKWHLRLTSLISPPYPIVSISVYEKVAPRTWSMKKIPYSFELLARYLLSTPIVMENKPDQRPPHPKSENIPPPPPRNKTPTPKPSTPKTHDHVRDIPDVSRDTANPQPAHPPPPTAGPQKTPSTYQKPGPGFQHVVTNFPGGWSYNTLTGTAPGIPQQHAQQQAPGYPPQVQQVQAPAVFYQQAPSTSYSYFHPSFVSSTFSLHHA